MLSHQVIEFQKRGLPHAHLLIWLEEKLHTPDKINRVASAELPDKEKDPILYDLVVKHMVHGPCRQKDPKARCMIRNQDGKKHCKYGYPMM